MVKKTIAYVNVLIKLELAFMCYQIQGKQERKFLLKPQRDGSSGSGLAKDLHDGPS